MLCLIACSRSSSELDTCSWQKHPILRTYTGFHPANARSIAKNPVYRALTFEHPAHAGVLECDRAALRQRRSARSLMQGPSLSGELHDDAAQPT